MVSDEILDGKLFEDVQAEKRQVLRARELAGLLNNIETQEIRGDNSSGTMSHNNIIRSRKTHFYRHHQKRMVTDNIASGDGFSSSLLTAMKEKQKEYKRKSYEKNKEKNKEEKNSKSGIYWAKNKEKVNEQRRNDWVQNKDTANEQRCIAAISNEQAEKRRTNDQENHLQQYHKKLETTLMPYARQCNIDRFNDSKGEKQHNAGSLSESGRQCEFCGAFYWEEECNISGDKRFVSCCNRGTILIPLIQEPNDIMQTLFTGSGKES
eukprot:gene27197-35725_t